VVYFTILEGKEFEPQSLIWGV